jgi:hypothetical protein
MSDIVWTNMDELLNEIRVIHLDAGIDRLLASIPAETSDYPCAAHYNHNEELFLELGTELVMPRFPIHHDMNVETPSEAYMQALRNLTGQLIGILPEVFRGLSYFFEPTEPLKPHFFRLYKVEDSIYLYLLRIDLLYRHFQGKIVEEGNNDTTPSFRTTRLFVESELIPLESVAWSLGRAKSFRVRQFISNTWIGETGRGYLIRGIWMDNDLSKFFSKIFLPEGSHTYPFYPVFCKYKTICAEAVPPGPARRKRMLPILHRAISLLSPEMERIQDSLRGGNFSESLPAFMELRKRVPPSWSESLRGIRVRSYLNEREMKEYALELDDKAN